MSEEVKQRYWERRPFVVSENKIDARFILREYDDPNDPPKAWGSLRIVSHPDLRPGYLRAYATYVISRRKKTEEEIQMSINKYQMEEIELEIYSVDEHIETTTLEHDAPKREIEEMFGVQVILKKKNDG